MNRLVCNACSDWNAVNRKRNPVQITSIFLHICARKDSIRVNMTTDNAGLTDLPVEWSCRLCKKDKTTQIHLKEYYDQARMPDFRRYSYPLFAKCPNQFCIFYSTLIFKQIIREIRQRLNYDWTHLILYVLCLDHPLLISITNSGELELHTDRF